MSTASAAQRRALMRRRAADRDLAVTGRRQATIPALGPDDDQPLSNAQERMWFFHQLDPAGSAYNVCVLWRLNGPLDRPALRTSLDLIGERHEILRTVYPTDANGVPRQRVLDRLPPEWSEHDLTHLAEPEQEQALDDLARAAGVAPFDLSERSPLRLALVTLGPDRHALIMVGQHIVWDGPAFGVFTRELAAAYIEATTGARSPLPSLPVQYREFAAWHRADWDGSTPRASRQLDYWRAQLTPLPEPLALPTDLTPSTRSGEQGGWCTLDVDRPATERLLRLAAEEQATPFMVLLAGVAVLLSRLGDAEEVTIGTIASNRTVPELEPLIGNIANTVALRLDVSGSPTFRQLVKRIRTTCRDAYANADVPFDRVLDELGVNRSGDRSPLLDTTVTFLAQDMDGPDIPGLDVTWEKFSNRTTQIDLSFDALLLHGHLGLQATYRTSLYRAETARRLLRRLASILEHGGLAPDRAVSDLSLLLPDEVARVLGPWATRPPARPAGRASTVVTHFERQVARLTDETALRCGVDQDSDDQVLSFGQLNGRANQLAWLLAGRGIGPEDTVAIALGRSAEFVVAMLAVLKAGAAYVPLDPRYPVDHLAQVITEARPAALVTDLDGAQRLGRVATSPPPPVVVALDDPAIGLDLASRSTADLTDHDRQRPLLPDHPAYVIFTSGSTGRPKGVVATHAGLDNLLASHRNDLYAEASRRTGRDRLRVGHAWSFAFDASWQPQLWLLDGHELHVLGHDLYADPVILAGEIRRRRLDFIELTPSLLVEVLPWLTDEQTGAVDPAAAARIPAVLGFGGEAVAPDLWAQLAALPDTTGFNLYGPTETTVDSLIAEAVPGTTPAVGHPVAGGRVAVLDRYLQPVPPGVPGELYISGAGLARGYLGQAGMTATRFIPDRFGSPGDRAYRTGDLVRWRDDGDLEFLGRADDQVKIRGFRVEPGEVEAALRQEAGGHPVAVAIRPEPGGEPRLIGYVATAPAEGDSHGVDGSGCDGSPVDLDAIRQRLTDRLPAHLVPSALVAIEQIPLLPNGKLDLNSLPAPRTVRAAVGRQPRNQAEEALCAAFATVLDVASVTIDDGFFDLGGDSISAIQLVSRARRAGWILTVRDVFDRRTLADLAAVAIADDTDTDTGGTASVGVHDPGGVGRIEPTAVMRRLPLVDGAPARLVQVVTMAVPAEVEADDLERALHHLSDHHDLLRARTVVEPDGSWWLDVPPAGDHDHQILHPTTVSGPFADHLGAVAVEAAARLAPGDGNMMQAVLLRSGCEPTPALVLVAHHLVVDAASWPILAGGLASAWADVAAGNEPTLAPVPTSFRRWAAAPNHSPATPADPGRPRRRPLAARSLDPDLHTLATLESSSQVVPTGITDALVGQVSGLFSARIDDLLIAGLALAVSSWSGNEGQPRSDLTVDIEGHGRDLAADGLDVAATVGWFTAITPAQLDIGPPDTDTDRSRHEQVGRAVKQVKEQIRTTASLDPATSDATEPGHIGFNYLGRMPTNNDSTPGLWSPVADFDATGAATDPGLRFDHEIELNVVVTDGGQGPELRVTWAWPSSLFDASSIGRLQGEWLIALESIVAHAARPGAGGATPSDVPLADLTQSEIESVEAGLGVLVGPSSGVELLSPTPFQAEMLCQATSGPVDPWTSQVSFTVDGPITGDRLRRAADRLLRRHRNLATGFVTDPMAAFVPTEATAPWREVDLSGIEPGEVDRELDLLAKHDQEVRFDLRQPPLLAFTFVRLPDDRHRVLLNSHRLLLDGWSVPLALRDLLALADDDLLPPPVPHRGFHQWLSGLDHGAALDAWSSVIAGLDGPTLVAPERGAVARTTDLAAEVSAPVSAGLRSAARNMGVTVSTLVQIGWAATLSELADRRDVVFGAVVSARSPELDGVDSLVGMLGGLVPVRVDLDAAATVRQAAGALHHQQAIAASHPHVDLAELSKEVRSASLFDTVAVFENFAGAVAPGGTSPVPGIGDVQWSDSIGYPLGLYVYPGESIRLRLCHDPGAVDGPTAADALARMGRVLGLLATDPDRSMSELVAVACRS